MHDETALERASLLPTMPDELKAAVDKGETIWTPSELARDFKVLGFMAPFVVVERKSDGVKGSLTFLHSPRFYFGWQEDKP
jgi:hypothetical protein